MYKTLEVEIFKSKLSKDELAKQIKISPSTLRCKLSGRTKFTLNEAFEIKKLLQLDFPIEVLFATDPRTA